MLLLLLFIIIIALENITFECSFCNMKFDKQRELEKHCRSELHKKKLTSDEDREWTFRAPPRGLNSDEYILCNRSVMV